MQISTDELPTSYERETHRGPDLRFVARLHGHKCARCWNFMPEVSNYGIWENVCTRCQSALKEMGIAPPQIDGAQPEAEQ